MEVVLKQTTHMTLHYATQQKRVFRIVNWGLPEELPLDGGGGLHIETSLLNIYLKIH